MGGRLATLAGAGSAGEEGAPVASLPRELLSHVFGLLDVAERSRASHVCRRWRAVALRPPHSTSLSLRLRHEWGAPEQQMEWPEEAWAPDPTALTKAELQLALSSPLAAGVKKLIVEFGRAAGPPGFGQNNREPAAARRWPLRAVLEALPVSVTSLEVVDVGFRPHWCDESRELEPVFEQLDLLQEFAPQLRELVLHKMYSWDWVPRHAGLERLDVGTLAPRFPELIDRVPSLRRLSALDARQWDLHPEDGGKHRALAALAERGLRVRSLHLHHLRAAEEGAVEAVEALFQPGAVGFGSGPATLQLWLDDVPPGGLPASFAAEAQRIIFSGSVQRSILPWLAAISRGPALERLELDRIEPDEGAGPRELLGALRGCREGLAVKLCWPLGSSDPAWNDDAQLADACAFIVEDRPLLRAVDLVLNQNFFYSSRPPHAGRAAFSRYRAERFDALAEHHALGPREKFEVREFVFLVDRALSEIAPGREPTDEERGELALYQELRRRAQAHLPEEP